MRTFSPQSRFYSIADCGYWGRALGRYKLDDSILWDLQERFMRLNHLRAMNLEIQATCGRLALIVGYRYLLSAPILLYLTACD